MKKILVFGERYFHYTDSTVYALEQLGFEVKVVYMPLLQSKELSIWEHINSIKERVSKKDIKLIEILSVKNIMSIRSCRYKTKCQNISRTSFFQLTEMRIMSSLIRTLL